MDANNLDLENQNINNFYYTNDNQINKMDDNFILSKVQEKYPDLSQKNDDNILKAVISLIINDIEYLSDIENKYKLNEFDVIKIIYRNYEYIFNTCFITRIQNIIKHNKKSKKLKKWKTK